MGSQTVQEVLRTTLADLPALRSFLGVNDANAAKERIHHDAVPEPNNQSTYDGDQLEQIFPCVMLYTDRYNTRIIGATACWNGQGAIVAEFYRATPTESSDSKIVVSFREVIDAIIQQLKASSGLPGKLLLREIHLDGPFRSDPEKVAERGDNQMYEVSITWGAE